MGPPVGLRNGDRLVLRMCRVVRRDDRSRRGAPGRPRGAVLLDTGRWSARGLRLAARSAVHVLRTPDHRCRIADPRLLGGIHGRRPRPQKVLRLLEPVRGRNVVAGSRRQLPWALRRVGGRRPGVVSPDRILVSQAGGGRRGEEGVHRQSRRRHRAGRRDDGDVQPGRGRLVRGRIRGGPSPRRTHADGHRAAAALGGMRQVRAGSVAVLVGRRDGRSDARLGAHPRRHHGHRRCLSDRAVGPGLRPRAHRAARRRDRRCGDAAVRRHRGLREGRHQEGACRIDHVADRLHGAGRRIGPCRLPVRDHAPAHPRLLQGGHVPRRRLDHARNERRGEHAPLRRATQSATRHLRDIRLGLSRHHRRAAAGRLLLQGCHHRSCVWRRRPQGIPARRRRIARCGYYRVLHDPGDADDVLRRKALARRDERSSNRIRTKRPR